MAANQLITSADEIRKYLPVSINIDIDNILPDIEDVINVYLLPILGQDMYDKLVDDYENDPLNEAHQQLLIRVQRAMVNLAYMQFIPVAQVSIDDAGIRIVKDGNMGTAFQWQIEALEKKFRLVGFRAIDQLLLHLDTNRDFYPEWKNNDEAFQGNKRYFINTAAEFSQEVNIQNSRLTFLNLIPVMRNVENLTIKPWIGSDLVSEIKAAILTGEPLNNDLKALMEYIVPAVAHLTISKAVLELGVDMSDGSIFIYGFSANANNIKESKRPEVGLLANLSQGAKDMGMSYLNDLKKFLNANASLTKYAAYFTSEHYTAPENGNPVVFKNKTGNKVAFF